MEWALEPPIPIGEQKSPFLDVHLYIIFKLDIGLKSPLLEGLGIL